MVRVHSRVKNNIQLYVSWNPESRETAADLGDLLTLGRKWDLLIVGGHNVADYVQDVLMEAA
jgi:hypothetical protein